MIRRIVVVRSDPDDRISAGMVLTGRMRTAEESVRRAGAARRRSAQPPPGQSPRRRRCPT